MIEALFVFTAAMTAMAILKMVSIMIGNSIDMPGPFHGVPVFELLSPSNAYVLYPSMMFQIWFWTNRIGLFNV